MREEFRLRSSYLDFDHHVMTVNAKKFKFSDLAAPIRLYRKEKSLLEKQPAPPNSSKSKFITEITNAEKSMEDEYYERVVEEESAPWLLEDNEDQSFVGRLEGGQQANYVFLVRQGNDFHVVPASEWYVFNPRLPYKPMTLEEAERSMHQRGKHEESRWAHLQRKSATDDDPQVATPPKLKIASGAALSLDQNYYSKVYDQDDLDFEVDKNLFQDDEGTELLDENEDSEKKSANGRRLRSAGKESATGKPHKSSYEKDLRGIMQRTRQDPNSVQFEEDEGDPYASDADDSPEPAIPRMASSSIPISNAISPQPLTQRSSPASQEPPAKVVKRDPNALITESDVIEILRTDGSVSAKDVIIHFSQQIKNNPQNKDALRDILKKIAVIRESSQLGKEENVKILELKEEFKKLAVLP